METYIPSENSNIHIHGRTVSANPLCLFWTGSGIEFNTDSTELYFDIETDYSMYEQWIRIEINGFSIIRMPLPKGKNTICAFRGMTSSIKNVRLVKEVQPMQNDPMSFLKVHGVECDGLLYPIKKRPYKIEFIGDSITSGEGLAGSRDTIEWIPMVFTTNHHYAVQTSTILNADYRIISQSGWGVYSSWDNNPNKTLSKYYKKICGVLHDDLNKALGTCNDYDFSSWVPDVIVVNLGCNDCFAFTSPEWKDPVSGRIYKQRIEEDGSYNKSDIANFKTAVYDFISLIRNCNPSSYILWTYGMIGRQLLPYISETVDKYIDNTGDENVEFQLLPDLKPEWIGANNHPGIASHTAAADVLVNKIKSIIE